MCRRKAVNDGERAVKGSAAKDVQMWLARWCIPSEHTHTHTLTHLSAPAATMENQAGSPC